jgi:hypothetical protein
MAKDRPEPSTASREMMRALADKIAAPLTVATARLEAIIEQSLIGLREGRFEDFLRGLGDAHIVLDEISEELTSGEATERAICSLDPAFAAFINPIRVRLAIDAKKKILGDRSSMDLISEYAVHKMKCADPKCHEIVAMLEVLKARGIEVPK